MTIWTRHLRRRSHLFSTTFDRSYCCCCARPPTTSPWTSCCCWRFRWAAWWPTWTRSHPSCCWQHWDCYCRKWACWHSAFWRCPRWRARRSWAWAPSSRSSLTWAPPVHTFVWAASPACSGDWWVGCGCGRRPSCRSCRRPTAATCLYWQDSCANCSSGSTCPPRGSMSKCDSSTS